VAIEMDGEDGMYAKPARVTTRVVSFSGDTREVDVFLGPALRRHYETETLSERLNAQGLQFLPVSAGDKVELLQLDYIADVQIEGEAPELERVEFASATRKQVTVHLSNGSAVRGEFVYMMPRERPRVSDALNDPSHLFLLVIEPGRSHYVNRKAVVRVEA
jgi:hypothetical protein